MLNNLDIFSILTLLLLPFIAGAFLGSFLNVLIDRLSTGRDFVRGRSYCESCKKTLGISDLIPLISYIYLAGKCRFCKKAIPFRLFLVEFLVGLIAVLTVFQVVIGIILPLNALLLFVILYSFLGIFIADIVYGIIPDLLVIVSFVFSFLLIIASRVPLQNHFLSAFSSFMFFFVLFALTRGRGMGFGDVKLSFVLGLLLGFPSIVVSLYLAFLTGAFISIILVVCRKLRFFGSTIPFGPFLIASTVIAYFYGSEILQFFLNRFF